MLLQTGTVECVTCSYCSTLCPPQHAVQALSVSPLPLYMRARAPVLLAAYPCRHLPPSPSHLYLHVSYHSRNILLCSYSAHWNSDPVYLGFLHHSPPLDTLRARRENVRLRTPTVLPILGRHRRPIGFRQCSILTGLCSAGVEEPGTTLLPPVLSAR